MNFFTFKLRNTNQEPIPEETQIKNIIQSISSFQTIKFQDEWVKQLLRLFSSKEEMHLFWAFFTQIYAQNSCDNTNPLYNSSIGDQNEDFTSMYDNYSESLEFSNNFSQSNGISQLSFNSQQNNQQTYGSQQDLLNFDFNQDFLQQSRVQSVWSQSFELPQSRVNGLSTSFRKRYPKNKKLTKDKAILSKVTLEQLRQQFKHSPKETFNIDEIANKYNVHKTTLFRLLKKWSTDSSVLNCLEKVIETKNGTPKKGSQSHQIQQWSKGIQAIIKQKPFLTLYEIKQQLKIRGYSYLPQLRTIRKILSSKRHTKKKVEKCYQKTQSDGSISIVRQQYCKVYIGMLQIPNLKIYFLDQGKFDLNNCSNYAQGKKGTHLAQTLEEQYISLLVILSQDGTCFWQTVNNQLNSFNCLQQQFQSISKINKNEQVIIINNIGISEVVLKQMLVVYQWKVVMIPPQFPQLNPAHSFFTEVRNQMKKIGQSMKSLVDVEQHLNEICPHVSQWKHSFKQIKQIAEEGINSYKF